MSKTEFTEEQMAEIAANPYTYRVTSKQVAFTASFKEKFWELYCKGVSSWNIMEILGYDPHVFGPVRVSGIQRHIRNEFRDGDGFHSGRKEKTSVTAEKDALREAYSTRAARTQNPQDTIRELQHEIKYMRQELEFLKKISLARTTKK
jgi:hypothetical protein